MVLTIIGAMLAVLAAYVSVGSAVYQDDYHCSGNNEKCEKVSTTVDGMVY